MEYKLSRHILVITDVHNKHPGMFVRGELVIRFILITTEVGWHLFFREFGVELV